MTREQAKQKKEAARDLYRTGKHTIAAIADVLGVSGRTVSRAVTDIKRDQRKQLEPVTAHLLVEVLGIKPREVSEMYNVTERTIQNRIRQYEQEAKQ